MNALPFRLEPMIHAGALKKLLAPAPAMRRERLDVGAAMGAGVFAGTLFLMMMLAFSAAIYGEPPTVLLRMIAATVRGPAALSAGGQDDAALAALGLTLHYAFAVLYALALVGVMVECRRALAPWLGLAFGAFLYGTNMHGFTVLFPWFADLRTLDTFLAHLVFGFLLSQSYWSFAGTPD